MREEIAHGPVTWAGPLKGDVATTVSALEEAGAGWAVAGTPVPVDEMKDWRRMH